VAAADRAEGGQVEPVLARFFFADMRTVDHI
jgi:hypothetical protein